MWNNLLSFYRQNQTYGQHGYVAGRSTGTCWKEILDLEDSYKYIYEFDLKGFFDNVLHSDIAIALQRAGMPKNLINYFNCLNKSIVKLTSEDIIEERDRFPYLSSTQSVNPNLSPSDLCSISAVYTSFLGKKLIIGSLNSSNISKIVPLNKERGVPQGAATSPCFST